MGLRKVQYYKGLELMNAQKSENCGFSREDK